LQDLISTEKKKELSVLECTCDPFYREKLFSYFNRLAWAKKQDTISKMTRAKRAGVVAQVVEHLPCKHKAMNSNSVLSKN
jgi:hypothetical protein